MPNRKRSLTTVAAVLAVWALSGTSVTRAQQPEKGKGEPMRGTWGFSASGTIVPPATPTPTPAAAVGVMTFQPTGECVIEDTINIGGTMLSRTSDWCFYVQIRGRGTLSAMFPGDLGPTPLSFVLVDHERELRFIRTDFGVAEGVAKLQ